MARVFAVDLGAWSVKVAVANASMRGAALTSVVERLVPPGDEPVEQRARGVLAQLINELRLRDDVGYLGVYGDQVFTQVLEFGFKSLRRAELDKAVGGELESVVPVDLEDMVYCFEPLPPVKATAVDPLADGAVVEAVRGRLAPPTEGMRVLTYAMPRERAEGLLRVGDGTGFRPRGVLACGGAAARIVERTPSLARARADGPVAVIDIGHERTDIIVVAQGKAVFSRSIARAGRHITDAIARHWKLSFGDAERAKHSDGFVASGAEPATSDAWAQIHTVTIGELTPFARDLRQTLAACRARTGFTPIAALIVGGGSRLRGMASFLSEQLGIPAWRLTADDVAALAGPRLAAEQNATAAIEAAALTVGMAYDAATGRPQFDLRVGSAAGAVDYSFLRERAVPIAASLIAIAACAAGAAFAELYSLRKAEKVLATRLADETTQHYGSAQSADQVLGTTSNSGGPSPELSPIPKRSAYDVLLEVSAALPPRDKVTLDVERMTIDEQHVDLSGSAKTGEEIDMLVTELKKIDCFKDVSRGPTETGEGGVKKFKLTISASCM